MLAMTRSYIVISGGIWDGLEIQLTHHPMVIGRHTNSDIMIEQPTVSRRHALISKTPRGVVLRDLHSANGTYVNDRIIGTEEYLLKNGDRIRLAACTIALVVRQESAITVASNAG